MQGVIREKKKKAGEGRGGGEKIALHK